MDKKMQRSQDHSPTMDRFLMIDHEDESPLTPASPMRRQPFFPQDSLQSSGGVLRDLSPSPYAARAAQPFFPSSPAALTLPPRGGGESAARRRAEVSRSSSQEDSFSLSLASHAAARQQAMMLRSDSGGIASHAASLDLYGGAADRPASQRGGAAATALTHRVVSADEMMRYGSPAMSLSLSVSQSQCVSQSVSAHNSFSSAASSRGAERERERESPESAARVVFSHCEDDDASLRRERALAALFISPHNALSQQLSLPPPPQHYHTTHFSHTQHAAMQHISASQPLHTTHSLVSRSYDLLHTSGAYNAPDDASVASQLAYSKTASAPHNAASNQPYSLNPSSQPYASQYAPHNAPTQPQYFPHNALSQAQYPPHNAPTQPLYTHPPHNADSQAQYAPHNAPSHMCAPYPPYAQPQFAPYNAPSQSLYAPHNAPTQPQYTHPPHNALSQPHPYAPYAQDSPRTQHATSFNAVSQQHVFTEIPHTQSPYFSHNAVTQPSLVYRSLASHNAPSQVPAYHTQPSHTQPPHTTSFPAPERERARERQRELEREIERENLRRSQRMSVSVSQSTSTQQELRERVVWESFTARESEELHALEGGVSLCASLCEMGFAPQSARLAVKRVQGQGELATEMCCVYSAGEFAAMLARERAGDPRWWEIHGPQGESERESVAPQHHTALSHNPPTTPSRIHHQHTAPSHNYQAILSPAQRALPPVPPAPFPTRQCPPRERDRQSETAPPASTPNNRLSVRALRAMQRPPSDCEIITEEELIKGDLDEMLRL